MANTKTGARHSAADQKHIQTIHDSALALGAQAPGYRASKAITDAPNLRGAGVQACCNCAFWKYITNDDGICTKFEFEADADFVCDAWEANPATVAPLMEMNDMTDGSMMALGNVMVATGGEIKALGNGKVGGYLVRFSSENDPDLEGEFFTKDTDFGDSNKYPVLYHHGLDVKLGRRRIGTAESTWDDVGMWLESQLSMRDAYEKAIYQMAEQGKLGWSSGAAGHTIVREPTAKATRIAQWYIAEASLTPAPAEYRNSVIPIKSVKASVLELPEAEAEAGNRADAATETAQAIRSNSVSEVTPMANENENKNKNENTNNNTNNENSANNLPNNTNAMPDIAKMIADGIAEGFKALNANEVPNTPAGGQLNPNRAPAHIKTGLGDNAFKAFSHYLKTGDAGGIRTGEAFENYMKTDYQLVEGTQYQGQEAVPTEVYAGIIEKRNNLSFARAAGAQVIQANSNAMVVPIEKAVPQVFVITATDGVTASATLTQQPLDKLAATIYLFTYNLPFHVTLLDDAVFDIEGWGTRYVGRGLAATENTYMTMGTGSGQPQGAIYGSTLGVTAASGTAVTAAEIASLYYKLPAEYQDNVIWAMLTATHGTVRALAAPTNGFAFVGDGGYNGGAGTGSAAPNAGWLVDARSRVYTPQGVDALTTSKKPIFVGNLSAGYAIIERQGLTVLRDPYSEASLGNVNIWFRSRWTAGVTNALALYHLLTPSA